MAASKTIITVEAYFTDLCLIRALDGATDECSLYVRLVNLLDAQARASASTA